MDTREILAELVRSGIDPVLIAEIAKALSENETLRRECVTLRNVTSRYRTANALRQKRYRTKSRKSNVTPPVHILSPPEISEPKKVLRSLCADWSLSDANRNFALSRGWLIERVLSEAEKFKDHFLGSGARKKDWDATWRNWVRSPYQQRSNGNGRHLETFDAMCDDLAERARTLEAGLFNVDPKRGH